MYGRVSEACRAPAGNPLLLRAIDEIQFRQLTKLDCAPQKSGGSRDTQAPPHGDATEAADELD